MKRATTAMLAAASILLVGIPACSSEKSGTPASGTPSSGASSGKPGTSVPPTSPSSDEAGASATVIVDGKNQNITAAAVCRTIKGIVNITIGGAGVGISAKLTDANPPRVTAVTLGAIDGLPFAFNADVPNSGNASATKNGNSYKVIGSAAGMSPENRPTTTLKPFEIDAACS